MGDPGPLPRLDPGDFTEPPGARADARRAASPVEAWRRGWLLTAAGRYGEALLELEVAAAGSPEVTAAARATRASLARQVGLHARAQVDDAAAAAVLAGQRAASGTAEGQVQAELLAEVAVGLVADAVGLRLAEELDRRLSAARDAVAAARSDRQAIRLGWVAGEVALVRGDDEAARAELDRSAALAHRRGWSRHAAKSDLFAGAALTAGGRHREAGQRVAAADAAAATLGALPLRWPAALILAEVADASGDGGAGARHRQDAAAVLGGLLASLPVAWRRDALRQPGTVAVLRR